MRITLIVGGIVVVDLSLLEREPADEPDNVGMGALSGVELFTGPTPFGFRPTPDPWPPSWE